MKVLPHNLEAENAVIGSLLIGGSIREITLSPEDFYSVESKCAYEAISKLQCINQITVCQEIDRAGKLNECGPAYLSKCISETPTHLDLVYYAEIVADLAYQRRIINTVESSKFDDLPQILKSKSQSLNDLIDPLKLCDYILNTTSERENPGFSWGFEQIDRINGGLYPDELYIIGARPSTGKTQLLQQVGINASSHKKVLFVSIEMSLRMLIDREIVMFTGLDIMSVRRRFLTDQQWGQVADLAGLISERDLYYLCGNRTTENIALIAERMQSSIGLDLLIIDYLQLMKDCQNPKLGATKDNRVGYVSARIKQIASDLHIPVILASQLNRASEVRENKDPSLADLRDSGCIEQDADCVLLLHRERESMEGTNLQVYQAKGRQVGRAEPIELIWDRNKRRYQN